MPHLNDIQNRVTLLLRAIRRPLTTEEIKGFLGGASGTESALWLLLHKRIVKRTMDYTQNRLTGRYELVAA
jgi:hypothetical protein